MTLLVIDFVGAAFIESVRLALVEHCLVMQLKLAKICLSKIVT